MSRKRRLQAISAFCILLVPVGLALWIKGLATEEWAASERIIGLAWRVIPLGIVGAILAGVAAARESDPDGKRDRVGLVLAGIGLILGVGILTLLLNLDIR